MSVAAKPSDTYSHNAFEQAFQEASLDLSGPPLVAIDLHELLDRELPKLEPLLPPLLFQKTISMVHSWRGVGKTQFALRVGFAVASGGSFLGWKAPRAKKVLYLDGEMAVQLMQSRSGDIERSSDATPPKGNFKIITPDLQDRAMPDLGTKAGQYFVDQHIEEDTALIIVDNISCLVRSGGAENDAESWSAVSEWALKHRREGRAVLFIHHSGKAGNQRGTSKREDLLDVVVKLERPQDCSPQDGAVFEIHFEKSRSVYGDELAPFEARLTTDEHGRQEWVTRDLENATHARIVELWEEGLSVTDIQREVDRHKSNITRALKRAQEVGKLKRRYEGRSTSKGKGA